MFQSVMVFIGSSQTVRKLTVSFKLFGNYPWLTGNWNVENSNYVIKELFVWRRLRSCRRVWLILHQSGFIEINSRILVRSIKSDSKCHSFSWSLRQYHQAQGSDLWVLLPNRTSCYLCLTNEEGLSNNNQYGDIVFHFSVWRVY